MALASAMRSCECAVAFPLVDAQLNVVNEDAARRVVPFSARASVELLKRSR